MKIAEILENIENSFHEKLETKTGWGKNEIKDVYKSAVIGVLAEIAEKVAVKS